MKLKSIVLSLAAAMCVGCVGGKAAKPTEADAALKAQLPQIFAQASEQYRGLLKRMETQPKNVFPKRWQDGKLVTVRPQDWCSGFFPGSLWYLYENTKAEDLKAGAEKFTAIQDQVRHYTGNHDIGFMLMTSVGNALRLAPKPEYKGILLDGAEALTKRFRPEMKLIRSWGKLDGTKDYLVIIDNMMNLELLEWASKNGGSAKFDEIARIHANTTDANHFRPDNSAYHVINYDLKHPGNILEHRSGQGSPKAGGVWSRGHAWSIYGYTMFYRETKDPRYLERAIKSADFAINNPNMPADGVPYWDYACPGEERDTSAGAIMASALLELAGFVEGEQAQKYHDFAVKALTSLASPAYFAKVGTNGNFLLMHGVGHKPGKSEVDVPLNYGDYYFLEALTRFNRLMAK